MCRKDILFKFNKKLIIFVYFISKEKRIVIQVRYNLLSNNFVYYTLYINIIEPKRQINPKSQYFFKVLYSDGVNPE